MIDILLEGIWSPIAFILIILLTTLVAYWLYKMGNAQYKKTQHKGELFISGNQPPEDIRSIHVSGDNLFWGFTNALKNYFEPLIEGHTGRLNDYVYWIIITLAVVLIYIYLAV